MKYLKIINIVIFVALCILLINDNIKEQLTVDGYYKRKEIIITKDEDRIELTTNIDVFADERKYTSIIEITDVDTANQYTSFSIDGDMYIRDGLLIAKTNKVEEVDPINKPVMFVASSSPIVSQIQKSLLGVNVFNERLYQPIRLDNFFCYYDLNKNITRCMK